MGNGVSVLSLLLAFFVAGAYSRTTISFTNKCSYTVWPALKSISGDLIPTGFQLDPGASSNLVPPPGWSGKFWARTGCSKDPLGRFKCATGDCGNGNLICNGGEPAPPATLLLFTIGIKGSADSYKTSFVGSYNLPISVTPQGGVGNCRTNVCPGNSCSSETFSCTADEYSITFCP